MFQMGSIHKSENAPEVILEGLNSGGVCRQTGVYIAPPPLRSFWVYRLHEFKVDQLFRTFSKHHVTGGTRCTG